MAKNVILLLALSAVLATLAPTQVAADWHEDYVRKSDYYGLRGQVNWLRGQVNWLKGQVNWLRGQSGHVNELKAQVKTLQDQVKSLQGLVAQVKTLQDQVAALSKPAPVQLPTTLTLTSLTVDTITVNKKSSFGDSVAVKGDFSCGSVTTPAITSTKVVVQSADSPAISTTVTPTYIELANSDQKWNIEVEKQVLVMRDNTCGGDKRYAFYNCKSKDV